MKDKHELCGGLIAQREESSCLGKHSFPSYEAAQLVQRKSRKSKMGYGYRRMTVYSCPFCGGYHLTGVNNRKGKR